MYNVYNIYIYIPTHIPDDKLDFPQISSLGCCCGKLIGFDFERRDQGETYDVKRHTDSVYANMQTIVEHL